MREDRFLIKIVEMYYREGLSQQEIGKKLNVSRATVSRMLIKARSEGYVQISINYPEGTAIALEKKMEEIFGLTEAIIAYPKDAESTTGEVSDLASDYLIRVLKDGMVIGMTRGHAMRGMIRAFEKDMRLKFMSLKKTVVVPLMGGSNFRDDASVEDRLTYSNYLIEEVSRITNGISYGLAAPQYVSSPETRAVFEQEEAVGHVLELGRKADIAMLGIGNISDESSIIKANTVSKEDYDLMKQMGAVGEIVGRVYNADGQVIEGEFNEKMICIKIPDLKKIPIRVGVAYGEEKVDAVLGALKGKLINVLITDKNTAESLLYRVQPELKDSKELAF